MTGRSESESEGTPAPAAAVLYAVSDGVATLTMDRPQSRNALSPALLNGLGDGLSQARDDPTVRVVVLTHTGPAFCAGADLSVATDHGPADRPRFDLAEILALVQDVPQPVVARIAGHCFGGGVGLAAACDLSVATDEAKFGFTEVRIGVAPAIVSVVCLPKLRRADALELFLTGARISASRAAQVGLITTAVVASSLDSEVDTLVAQLLAGAPGALAATKRLVFDVPAWPRATAFEQTTAISQRLFESEEAAEGLAAFREKRPASWVPRT